MSLMLFDPLPDFSWPEIQKMEREMGSVEMSQDGAFKYTCNFQGFRPSDISVRHEGNNVILEAEYKNNGRHGYVERSLKRMIKLPDGMAKESVRCDMNEKGQIVIHAHKPALDGQPKRVIPVTFKKSKAEESKN